MNTAQAVRGQYERLERQGYSPAETAIILGCGRTSIYEMLKRGRLRHVKVGARTVIPKVEIEKLLSGGNDDGRAA